MKRRIILGLGAVLLFAATFAAAHVKDGDPWPCFPVKVCGR